MTFQLACDLVLEGPRHRERADPVRGQAPGVAEPVRELGEDLVGDGRRVRGEAHPHEPFPRVEGHRDQPERAAVEVARVLEPGGSQEAAVEPVGPRVIAALERARLAALGRAELGARGGGRRSGARGARRPPPARRGRSRPRPARCGSARRPGTGPRAPPGPRGARRGVPARAARSPDRGRSARARSARAGPRRRRRLHVAATSGNTTTLRSASPPSIATIASLIRSSG